MSAQSITDAPKQSSAAKIAANKANAQKSTGPRTTEGKAAVANNAHKHGLRSERNPLDLANDAALPAEREELLTTLTGFIDSLHPITPLETQLVERLAQLNLRLNRALRMETTHLNVHAASEETAMTAAGITRDASNARQNKGIAMLAFLRDPNALTLIGRYESRLSRDFARTLAQLHQLQKLRKQTQPTEASAISTRSVASNGHIAEIPTEQTQRPVGAAPTRYHVSDDVAQSNARAAQPTPISTQTNPIPHTEAQA